MIHEMCHQFAEVNNIQDTSRSHLYHNKLFKQIAENHGLSVECVKTYGWTATKLTESTKLLVDKFTSKNPTSIIYREANVQSQRIKSSSTRKYVCHSCGCSVRATKKVCIKCADCDKLMICDEE